MISQIQSQLSSGVADGGFSDQQLWQHTSVNLLRFFFLMWLFSPISLNIGGQHAEEHYGPVDSEEPGLVNWIIFKRMYTVYSNP